MTAEAAGVTTGWVAFQAGWHEFFLMTGTAAVTLAGLLFVAISLHVETLIHESRGHLLALARSILLSYVMVLTFSLMMLVPAQPVRVVAVEMTAVAGVFLIITLGQLRGARGIEHPDFPLRLFRRRLMPMLIGYGRPDRCEPDRPAYPGVLLFRHRRAVHAARQRHRRLVGSAGAHGADPAPGRPARGILIAALAPRKRPTSNRDVLPRTFCRGGTPLGVGGLHLPAGGSP